MLACSQLRVDSQQCLLASSQPARCATTVDPLPQCRMYDMAVSSIYVSVALLQLLLVRSFRRLMERHRT